FHRRLPPLCATGCLKMFTVIGILHQMRLSVLQKIAGAAMGHLWLAYIWIDAWLLASFTPVGDPPFSTGDAVLRCLCVTRTCNPTSFLLHQSALLGDRATDAPRFETRSQRRSEHETAHQSAQHESRAHRCRRR